MNDYVIMISRPIKMADLMRNNGELWLLDLNSESRTENSIEIYEFGANAIQSHYLFWNSLMAATRDMTLSDQRTVDRVAYFSSFHCSHCFIIRLLLIAIVYTNEVELGCFAYDAVFLRWSANVCTKSLVFLRLFAKRL